MVGFHNRKIRVRVGSSLAVLALVMTALLSSSPSAGSTTKTKSTGSSELTIINSPEGPFADGFNPFALSNSAYGAGATGMIYEPLMQFNMNAVGQIYPWLATSWSWVDNGKELVLHTRTGVKWQDGKPFSAADVAYTFNLMRKYPALDVNGVTFLSASAPSSTEAILKFSSAAYTQLFDISQVLIVPEHIWKNISNPVIYADDNPVGTGPYTVSSFSAEEFTLVRNPNYWQKGLPKIARLHFLASASNTSASLAISAGQIDWSGAWMGNWKTGFVDKNPKTNHVVFSPQGNQFLCPNLTEYPFNLTVVRKAMSEAINRPLIASEGEREFYSASTSQTGLSLPRWSTWLAPQYSGLGFKFDPNGAKKLLEKAGFKAGSDGMLNMPNGKPFTFTILGPSSYTDFMTDLQIVVSELRQAGIGATLNGVSVSAWTNDYTVGNYQVTICGQFINYDPYSMYDYMLNSALSAPIGKPATGDLERFTSATANKALAAAASTDNHAALLKAYTTLEGLMVNDVPAIPLFFGGTWAIYSTAHAVGWPSASNNYEMNDIASPWSEVVVLHLRPVS
jgi:peptide/nickel transport system substrate-binding protein